jgi:hypothetical protein
VTGDVGKKARDSDVPSIEFCVPPGPSEELSNPWKCLQNDAKSEEMALKIDICP